MRDPQIAVPAQFPSARAVAAGDIVFAEISAAFWDYPGQVLRSFALGEPTPLYRALHAAADTALDAIAAVLRDGAPGDRGRSGDRGRRLHHDRRSASRLWRRLPAADPRYREPPGRAGPAGAVPRRHDGRDPAECRDAGWQGRRADRRD